MKINFSTLNINNIKNTKNNLKTYSYSVNPFVQHKKDSFEKTIPFKGDSFELDEDMQKVYSSLDEKDRKDVTIGIFLNLMMYTKNKLPSIFSSYKNIVNETIATQAAIQGGDCLKYLLPFFEENDIKTNEQLTNLVKFFEKLIKVYPDALDSPTAFMDVKSKIDNEEDLLCFPQIALAYQNLSDEGYLDDNIIDINKTILTLKKIGVKNEANFQKNFSYLKERYGNFEYQEDLLFAMHYLAYSYTDKEKTLQAIIDENPELKGIKPEQLYTNNSEIINYLSSKSDLLWPVVFEQLALLNPGQEKITPKSQQVVDRLMDTSTPSAKLDFLVFLAEQDLDISKLNRLTSLSDVTDIKHEDLIINKNAITEYVKEAKEIDDKKADDFYFKFAQVLNSVYENEDSSYLTDGTSELIKIIDDFNLKNDRDFIRLYNDLSQANSQKNQQKGKKTQNKPQKPKQTDIRNFVELLSFRDKSLLEKYQKNIKSNKQMFITTLQKRKKEFELNKQQIENSLNNSDLVDFSTQSAFDVYKKYIGYSLNHNISLSLFLNSFDYSDLKDSGEYKKILDKFNSFRSLLANDEQIRNFISKNEIKLDNSKENETYYNHCIQIIRALGANQNEKYRKFYQKKLLENDFIKNSKTSLASILNHKSEKEIRTLFETILAKDINTIQELNAIVNVCKTKNKNSIIEHFQSQTNIDKYEYPKRMQFVKEALKTLGAAIVIDDSNIGAINLENFPLDKKVLQKNLIELANDLAKAKGQGNFIANLESAKQTNANAKISPYKIATEITNTLAKDITPNYNIMRELRLPPAPDSSSVSQNIYRNVLANSFPQEFINLVCDNEFEIFDNGEKFSPNITIHAKLRAIERFVLNNTGSFKKLYTSQAKDDLTKLFKTIYTSTPLNITKSKDDRFVATFMYNSTPIKAVFANNGMLITVSR